MASAGQLGWATAYYVRKYYLYKAGRRAGLRAPYNAVLSNGRGASALRFAPSVKVGAPEEAARSVHIACERSHCLIRTSSTSISLKCQSCPADGQATPWHWAHPRSGVAAGRRDTTSAMISNETLASCSARRRPCLTWAGPDPQRAARRYPQPRPSWWYSPRTRSTARTGLTGTGSRTRSTRSIEKRCVALELIAAAPP